MVMGVGNLFLFDNIVAANIYSPLQGALSGLSGQDFVFKDGLIFVD